jgi:hypothetical protein
MFKQRSMAIWGMLCVVALILLAGSAAFSPMVLAQDWSFNVEENVVHVYLNGDGTARIVYDITFVNDPGAPAMDGIDVGMPNGSYDLSASSASINGVPLTDIGRSPYVTPGIGVELGSHAIGPGQVGKFHFETTVRDLIYQDSKDADYASVEFAPTWFDSSMVHGPTRVEVNFHLPPGVTADEPRYHDEPFTEAYFEDDRVVYSWVKEDAQGDRKYVFGASFPKEYLAEGVVQTAPAFRLPDLSACCSSPVFWIAGIAIGWAVMAFMGNRSQKQRRMKYMPPALSVEGSGIKRGLTAVEAAILLEAPLDRVITMILFGLVKKGVITVESEKPLRVKTQDPLPKDVKLWYYERRFLDAIGDDGKPAEGALRELIIDLIGDVNKKLTGFSRNETKVYYKDIAARAWQQVETSDTPEVLGQRWGEGLEWTMLDDDWDDRTREVFRDRPVVLPHWWWFYRPWTASTGHARPSTPMPRGSGGTPVTLPTLPGADFANTVVSGVENAANTVVSSVESFTSRITGKTNPPPKRSSSSSSGRSGGYSCACACACAGCACACAGGGR